GALLPHHGDRLRQRRPAPRPRLREDRRRRDRPVPPADGRRRALPDRDGRARAEGGADRRRRRARPAGAHRPRRRVVPAHLGAARGLPRPVHPHHVGGAPRRRAGAHRADLRALAGRLLRALLPRAVLRGVRGVQDRGGDRRRPVRAAPHAHARVGGGAQLVLPAEPLHRVPQAPHRRAPRVRAAGEPAQRDPRAARAGAGGRVGEPRALRVGRPLPAPHERRRAADHLRVVRRAPQLPHGHRLSGRGLRGAVAGRPARDRQGHHALPLRDLAGDARGRGAPAPAAGVGARLRAPGRRAVQQVGRRAARPRRGDRPLRRRRLPVLPAARGPLRRRRELLVGAVRGALHGGPRQRLRQPGQPHGGDGREVLRRRGAARRAERGRRRRRGRLRPLPRRARRRHGRLPALRRPPAALGDGGPGQRVRGPAGAVEARQGRGPPRGARRHARDARAAARAAGRGARAVHAGEGRRALGDARRAGRGGRAAVRGARGDRPHRVAGAARVGALPAPGGAHRL
ncbi:MAG: Methionyl-tRNA synthetase, partial [uncultured Gemmatimonadaceae bacterium]